MDKNNEFANLISRVQQSSYQEEIEECCEAFCSYAKFDNYLVFGSIFTSLVSPPHCLFGNTKGSRKSHLTQIETIKNHCISKTTPVINGNFEQSSLIPGGLIKTRTNRSKKVSITFPIHFPMGKFAFLHISAIMSQQNSEEQILSILAPANLFAREVGNSTLRLLESKLESKSPYLSTREKECLLMATDGTTPKRIAEKMGLSPHTVIYHLKKAREKLKRKNIQGAISKAMLLGDIKVMVDSEKR